MAGLRVVAKFKYLSIDKQCLKRQFKRQIESDPSVILLFPICLRKNRIALTGACLILAACGDDASRRIRLWKIGAG